MVVSKRSMLIYSFMLAIIIIGACGAHLFNNSYIVIGIIICTSVLFLLSNSVNLLEYIICFTVFQNTLLFICAKGLNKETTQIIILIKELCIYIPATLFFIKSRLKNLELLDILTLTFLVYAIVNLFFFAPSILNGAFGLRQITVVYFCFYFGRFIKIDTDASFNRIFSLILFLTIIVCFIGLGLYLWPNTVWERLGYEMFYFNKTGSSSYSLESFYTWDLGFKVKRFISIFVDPLACAHFLGLAFTISFILKESIILRILITICLILGLSKGSLLLIIWMTFLLNYRKIKSKANRFVLILLCFALFGISLLLLTDYTNSLQINTSVGNHFKSFLYGLQNMSFTGYGLGTTGYNSKIMGATIIDSNFNESFFSVVIGQMGAIGLILFYSFLIILMYKMMKIYTKTKNKYILISLILVGCAMLESLVSASSISMLGTGLYFIIAGVCYSNVSQMYLSNHM